MDCAHPNVLSLKTSQSSLLLPVNHSSVLLPVNHSSVAPESQPLRRGHTRVLCIMPDSFDSPVVCKVLQMKVYRSDCENSEGDFSGPYEALSYTWGNPDRNHYITWNDKAVGVTENLYSALVHLRLTDKPRYLWSDAICINQNDVDEKNSQVQQIMAIYKGADRVIAF